MLRIPLGAIDRTELLAPADCDHCGIRVSDYHGLFKYSRKLVLMKPYIYNGLEYSFERLLIRLNNSKSYSRWMGDTSNTTRFYVTEVRSTNRWWFIDSPSSSSEVSRPAKRGCPVETISWLGVKSCKRLWHQFLDPLQTRCSDPNKPVLREP
jgi:hypothetical protein